MLLLKWKILKPEVWCSAKTARDLVTRRVAACIHTDVFIKDSGGNVVTGENDLCQLLADHFEKNHALTVNNSSPLYNSVERFMQQFKPVVHVQISKGCPALADDDKCSLNPLFVTPEKVIEIVSSRNNKSSAGSDKLPNKIIKLLEPQVFSFFAIIFNHIIAIGHFPKCWRSTTIIPIPEQGKDKTLLANWRPISLLSCFSKIFERLIAERMKVFCEENEIIPSHQFGFRSGHSTYHPLALLQNKINRGLNVQKATTLICLDIKAAFDTVWHNGLVYKLSVLKFPNYMIHIIATFLKNRSFQVKIGNSLSEAKSIVAGVP